MQVSKDPMAPLRCWKELLVGDRALLQLPMSSRHSLSLDEDGRETHPTAARSNRYTGSAASRSGWPGMTPDNSF